MISFQRSSAFSQEEIERCFREGLASETGATTADKIYETYQMAVTARILQKKENESGARQFSKIDEIEPEPEVRSQSKNH